MKRFLHSQRVEARVTSVELLRHPLCEKRVVVDTADKAGAFLLYKEWSTQARVPIDVALYSGHED
jgi:hypothetical protein